MALMAHELFRARTFEGTSVRFSLQRRHIVALLTIFFSIVLLDAIMHARAGYDLATIKAIQSLDAPGLATSLSSVSLLTGSIGAVAVWVVATLFFAARRTWSAVIAMAVMPLGGLMNTLVGEFLADRTRPHLAELERTSSNLEERSFPSGHVMGAVLFYGLIFVLARRIENRALRLSVQAVAVGIVAASSFGRVWQGAHWPSDVVGALLLGGLLLIGLIELMERTRSLDRLPLIRAQALEHDEQDAHAHALTSLVLFQGTTVAKIYSPGLLPRAIYWLSFQAPFPYMNNVHALWAAAYRRNLAGSLTEYWYGDRRVAGVLGVSRVHGRMALVSEFIGGQTPVDKRHASAFLNDLRTRFEEAGLPTWQIDARQPRAIDNILQTSDGGYKIVDLESGLVSPLASVGTWRRAIDRNMVPFFDEIFFDVLRAYVDREAPVMAARMGDEWLAELRVMIENAENQVRKWHDAEPRIWQKAMAFVASGFGVRTAVGKGRAVWAGGNEKAMSWIDNGITRWEREARLNETETVRLRDQISQPDFQQMMPYFGGHILLSIPLRFPFGSIIRPLLVLGALGWSSLLLLRRKISRAEWKRAFGIHSPLVMIVAAIPGLGSVAYLASEPIRRNRLMMRVMADAALFKLPKGIYLKSGVRKWIARPVGGVLPTPEVAAPPAQLNTDLEPMAA